jgi:four helix bundle protein
MASDHKDLIVRQRSMKLVKALYLITQKFPKEELYGLTSQIRRAAASVPSNLAEGHAMKTTPHCIKFVYVARGSLAELETQLMIGRDLDYISADEFKLPYEEVINLSRMPIKMIAGLNRRVDFDQISQEIGI